MVLKCTLKPIGYIFFPFLILGIILWNISYKTDYNFKQGISIKQLISASFHLSVLAGREIVKKNVIEKKHNALYLSSLSQGLIFNGLAEAFPGIKIVSKDTLVKKELSEDSIIVNKHVTEVEQVIHHDLFVSFNDVSVWINALDGANDYTEGSKFFTTSICVVFRGHPIVSVMHHPSSNETYWAWTGYYKSKNLFQKLKTKKKQRSIVISKSLGSQELDHQARLLFGNKSTIKAFSGTGFKTIMIIKGLCDYFYHPIPIHKCDICAAYVLLLATKGFIFPITTQMGKEEILNKTRAQYREKILFSLDKQKWVPGVLFGKET